ncbi:unnamed protein product [Cunninghamella blakesleeana]
MLYKNLKIEIIPESDTVHLFHDEELFRNEGYEYHGRLRLIPLIEKQLPSTRKRKRKMTSPPPTVSVQHIHLRLQGYVQTKLTSTTPEDNQDVTSIKKQCKDVTSLSFLDRLLYSAKGYANVTECIIDQHMMLTPNIASLTTPTDIPFNFIIEDSQRLPPSMHSTDHLICYYMTAHIQEDTTTKQCSICLQQQQLQQRQHAHQNNGNCCRSLSLSTSLSANTSYSYSSSSSSSSSSSILTKIIKIRKSRKSKIISSSIKLPIEIQNHTYNGLYHLQYQPRIKYCGSRPSCLQYQIHLPKYILYDNHDLHFQCHFRPLLPSIHIEKVSFYFLQIEKYPYRPGEVLESLRSEFFQSKSKKIGYKEYIIDAEKDDLENIDLNLPIDTHRVSLPVNTNSLTIEHKLRLVVQFSGKIKRMALSFPVEFSTIPPTNTTQPRLLTPDSIDTTTDDLVLCKLPSYHDVMTEGAPPSPF